MRILVCGINYAPESTGIGRYSGEMARDQKRSAIWAKAWSRPSLQTWPRRVASTAPMVAIFAVRTKEAAGRPVPSSSAGATSLRQPRLSALVIMTIHSSSRPLLALSIDTTSAGRNWRVGLLVQGMPP